MLKQCTGGSVAGSTSDDAALFPSGVCVPEDDLVVVSSGADGSAVWQPAHCLCQVLVSGVGGQQTSCVDIPDVDLFWMRTCS